MDKPVLEVVDWVAKVTEQYLGGSVEVHVIARDSYGVEYAQASNVFDLASPLLDYVRYRVEQADDGTYTVTAAKLIADYEEYTGRQFNVFPSALGAYLVGFSGRFGNAGLIAEAREAGNRMMWMFTAKPKPEGAEDDEVVLDNLEFVR